MRLAILILGLSLLGCGTGDDMAVATTRYSPQAGGGKQSFPSSLRVYRGEKTLAVGDSITYGPAPGPYWLQMFNLAVSNGRLPIIFDGPVTSQDPIVVGGTSYAMTHAGYSGATVNRVKDGGDGYGPGIVSLMGTYRPRVMFLMVGINDVSQSSTAGDIATYVTRYRTLLDTIILTQPDIWIIASTITPYALDDAYDANVTLANTALIPLQSTYRANVSWVDSNAAIKANVNWKADYYPVDDGFHPTVTGHTVIRNAFYPVVFP